MSEVVVAPASQEEIRSLARRRGFDEIEQRLALELCERASVWTARDEFETIGCAIAHRCDDEIYVGDLFVEPSYRAQGIGTRLLEAAFPQGVEIERALAMGMPDPAASALALHHRLGEVQAILRLDGTIAREEELAKMAAGDYRFAVEPIDALAHAYPLAAIDRDVRGTSRMADHAAFVRSASGSAFSLNGEFVGYAYAWPDGRIGPLAAASAAYVTPMLAYALMTLRRRFHAQWCSASLPAANVRAGRALLRSGLRIRALHGVASSIRPDSSRYLGYHRFLW